VVGPQMYNMNLYASLGVVFVCVWYWGRGSFSILTAHILTGCIFSLTTLYIVKEGTMDVPTRHHGNLIIGMCAKRLRTRPWRARLMLPGVLVLLCQFFR